MKDNDDIPITDTTEIQQLINRDKQGEFDQGDALSIEKLLNILQRSSLSYSENTHRFGGHVGRRGDGCFLSMHRLLDSPRQFLALLIQEAIG